MDHRERIILALKHKEPDRIPLDLGGAPNTSITKEAYIKLCNYLGFEKKDVKVWNNIQQLALVDENILAYLKVDTRQLILNKPSYWELIINKNDSYSYYKDEWGVEWKMPLKNGHYYDMNFNPLREANSIRDVELYKWPDPCDNGRIMGLLENAKIMKKTSDAAIMLGEVCGGIFDMSAILFGYEKLMENLIVNIRVVQAVMEKIVDFKCEFYKKALNILHPYVDIVLECDDMSHQQGPMFNPKIYRKYIKPLHKKIMNTLSKFPDVYRYFHSCGSVYEYIPDFIEVGIQILNPIQVSAYNMDTKVLKKNFGRDLVFWGGGCDTQKILPRGTVKQVREEVKKRIDDLAVGGGYVFAQVHNIQSDVPAENLMAMWEAFYEFSKY